MNLLLFSSVFAQRPDEGGLFSFSSSDILEYHDGASFRVHYSIDGPNQTILDDADENGVPDFVEEVALTADEVLAVYEDTGFRRPLSEEEIGLELGGSPAFDFYLVDFGGSSDGMFGIDDCIDHRCVGYMVMENDFSGYGYSSISSAISTLVSHELFHAVQAAYRADQESWLSEGMAVWAEHLFEPELRDYLYYCSEYLEHTERSLNRPPAGAVTSFSYSTALWFGFLQEKWGSEAMISILEELDTQEDSSLAMFDAIGEDFFDLWHEFGRWNLATSRRAGVLESYPYAGQLHGLRFVQEGAQILDEHRFYPLTASYFRLDHTGGTVYFSAGEGAPDIVFSVHPTDDDAALEAMDTWEGEQRRSWELEAGTYFLVGSFAHPQSSSQKIEICFGPFCAFDEEEQDEEEEVKNGCGGSQAYLFIGVVFLFHRRGRWPKTSIQS